MPQAPLDADTLFALGLRYANGDGVPLNYVIAHKWFNLAAMAGSAEAREIRAEIARDMRRDEVAEAQRQARCWLSARAH